MANYLLKFKHGLEKNINATAITPGTVYVTRDERAIYVDLPAYISEDNTQLEAAKRIRIGDMRVFEYYHDLTAILGEDPSILSQSALFYVEKTLDEAGKDVIINGLYKWTGTGFIQLNTTSELSANLDGLIKRVGDAETDLSMLKTTVEGHGSTLSTHTTDISNLQTDIANLKGEGTGSITEQIAAAVAAEAQLRENADNEHADAIAENAQGITTNANAISTLTTTVEGLTTSLPNDYVKKADAIGYTDILTKTVAAETYATKTNLTEGLNGLLGTENDDAEQNTIYGAHAHATAVQNYVSSWQTTIEGIQNTANTTRDNFNDYVETNNQKVENIKTTADNAATKTALQEEIDRATQAEKNLSDAWSADKTTIEGDISNLDERLEIVEVFFASTQPGVSEDLVDTLKELQAYIAQDESGAAAMLGNIQKNSTDIETINESITSLNTNITTLEGNITSAENNAKTYTDDLLAWGQF